MKKSIRIVIDVIAIIILIVLDQLSKKWATVTLKDTSGIPIIKDVLELYYLPNGNSGAAFGMLQGQQTLFLIIATVVIIGLFYLLCTLPYDKKYRILHVLMILIIAGGAGNMIDRAFYVTVVDFIYFKLINFPIFNVADCYVSVATVLLAILLLFYYKEEDMAILEKAIKAPLKKENKEQ